MEFLLLIVCVVIVLIFNSRISALRARLEHIERYLAEHTAQRAVGGAPTPAPQHAAPSVLSPEAMLARSASTPPMLAPQGPDAFDRFGHWLKEDWLMKLAGLLVILGMGWFVSYAIAQNWIGEAGRIALGLILGASVLALGRYRLQSFLTQGSVLMFTGATIMVLTLFAARELYDMFTPLIALVLMFGISGLLGLTSVITKHQPLAIANVLLAGVAPLLVNSPDPSLVGLMTYLLVLSVGAVGVAVVTGWRMLPFLSLLVLGLYSGEMIGSRTFRSDLDTGLLYAYAFTALFFGVSILAMRVARKVQVIDLGTAVLAGIFLMAWIFAGAKEEWQSLLFVVWAVVFACGAYLATRLGAGSAYFYSYAGVGATYLGIATALELDGPSLTIAAICEATLVLWLGYRITGSARHIVGLALPMVIPILLSFESMASSAWRNTCGDSLTRFGMRRECVPTTGFERIFHEDALVLVLMVAILALLGAAFYAERLRYDEKARELVKGVAQVAWVGAGLYLTVLVWLGAHALATNSDTGTMLALLVYTVVAGALYISHRATGRKWERYTAIALTIFVVGRLLLVEAWQMDLLERVITFLVVGVVLGVVAWLERTGRHATESQDHEQPNIEHHA